MFYFYLHQRLKNLVFTLIAVTAILFFSNTIPTVSAYQPAVHTTLYAQASDWTVHAQEGEDLSSGGSGLVIKEDEVTISGSISHRSFGDTLLAMVNYFIGFLGFLTTLAFVYAGVLWVLSGGNEDSITKAKKIMTYAALGMVVVILSFSAVRFIAGSAGGGDVGGGGAGEACNVNGDCEAGLICGFDNESSQFICTEPSPSGNICRDNADCPLGFKCNETSGRCDPYDRPGAIEGGPADPAYGENLDNMDSLMENLENDLDVSGLSDEVKEEVKNALTGTGGDTDQQIENLEDMLTNLPEGLTEADTRAIENLIDGLKRLKLIRAELEKLHETMPESKEILQAYDDTSDDLETLSEDPTNKIKYRRFDAQYKKLKQLVRDFPYVLARIFATPGQGNVPFSVQFDGLDSVDPTGGTISAYRWSYLDSAGKEVSLGSDPVVIHEFTEPNTYAVRLKVSTSQLDSDGYKTAADGVSVVRVQARPPESDVRFRINGTEAEDIMHVTLQESQAGLAFDPSSTVPAMGRTIQKYEWFYGDTGEEVRLAPTTVVHTYDEPGDYFVKLQTTDSLGVKDKRIVKLFVKSLAADIRFSPATGNVNTEFNFIGLGSRSDDGVIKDYAWQIQDAEGRTVIESDEDSFYHRFDRPGTYNVILQVTDIAGIKDRYVRELVIFSRSPVANFEFSTPTQNHPNRFEFNAVDSYDPDEGDQMTYSWDFDGNGDFDVIDSEEALVTYDYKKAGEYRAKLQVEDSFGQRSQVEKKVSVKSVLSGDIQTNRQATRVGEPIEFTADSPNAVAYLWEFGDGETQSSEETTMSHTYNKSGKFTVKMNFFDKDDNENYDTQRILVGAGDEPMAAISYTVNGREARLIENLCGENQEGAVVTRADLIRLDARNSINTDGSSRLLSYDWNFPGGEKSSNKESSYKFDEISKEGECFSVSLIVRDQLTGKLSKEDKTYFKVINQLPQITDFVITPPETDELITPAKVRLKVVNPKDMDGTIKKYRWWYTREGFEDERLGVHSTSASDTEIVITSFGEPDTLNRYFFVVEITDNDNGAYNSQERFGEVSYLDVKNGPNLSPVAEFTMDKTTISVGDSITFISRSYDPQGDPLPNDAFRWDFDGDGEFDDTTSGPQVNRQFNTPGEYEVRLKVVYRGLSSSASKIVFVETTESLPQAAFTYTIEGNTVRFDGSHSRFDPTLEDTTLRFEWDFDIADDANGNGIKDDDVQSTEMTASFEYPDMNLHRVKLKVKDFTGMEGVVVRDVDLNQTEAERQRNAYKSLRISAPKNPLTTLDIEIIPIVLEKGGSADLSVRVLNADGSPYNGKVFFEIMEGSGMFTPNPAEAKDSKASTIFNAADTGKTRIRVRATDTLHGELTEEATFNIK